MLFPQSPFNDFNLTSRQKFIPKLHRGPQTQTHTKTLLLQVYTPVNLIDWFLIIPGPTSYTALNYRANFYDL